jgi:AcrR family transcriptional regulator
MLGFTMETTLQDTRTALLQAALACFANHGFDGTSMRRVAESAGRPLSLLSHYFRNKEGLYLEVFKHIFESSVHVAATPPDLADRVPRDRQGAIRLLREQIHLMYQEAVPNETSASPFQDYKARLWLQEFQSPRPCLQPIMKQHLSPITNVIRECIRVIRPDFNEAQVAFIGITITGQAVSHGMMGGISKVVWGDYPHFGTHFQEAELLVDFCLHGLVTTNVSE